MAFANPLIDLPHGESGGDEETISKNGMDARH